ncbi:VCBS repeat-containing protein, partial [Acinetobacter baumannii]
LSIRAGGGFADLAPPDLAEPGAVRTVLAADFDNDGYQELFFNLHGEPNRLFAWRHDQWQAVDAGDALVPRGLGTGAVAADLDGDGRLELLV